MMCVASIMFSLIHSEICNVALEESIKTKLTSEVRRELYKLSNKHDVAHIVASALSKAELLGEDEISETFKNALMRAVYRDAQREYAITQIIDILENSNIPHILLKGSAICKYYPQTWMRTSCDVDILVKKKDVNITEKILCNSGFIRIEDSSTHDYSFISPNKIHIELHFSLVQDGELSATDEIVNGIWDNVILEQGKSYCYNMTEEMFVFYHLIHMGKHLLHGGCGVRPFVDFWLLENKMPFNESVLREMLSSAELLALYETVSALGKVWMDNKKHVESTKLLEAYVLCGGVYGTTSNSAQVKVAKGESKIKSFLNLMFLPKNTLEVIFPKLKKHPYMFPLYQIKRWFRVFNKSKRSKLKHLTSTRNIVSQSDVDATRTMLEHLGLLNDQIYRN